MKRPRSTYRLQVNADFTLSQVRALIRYFVKLGISDLYLSPLFQARPGSTHGYDVTDPAQVNVEIGTTEELEELSAALRAHDMGILLDIVPNHMSASEGNPWWRDVLEHGPASAYAHYFDVDWTADPPGAGRVVLPMLAEEPARCIAGGDLRVVIHDYEPAIAYHDRRLPLDPATYPLLIAALRSSNGEFTSNARKQLERIAEQAAELPNRSDTPAEQSRMRLAAPVKQRLANVLRASWKSGDRDPIAFSPDRLNALLEQQAYTLRYWVSGSRELNYRRFFDIPDLAGLRTDEPEVFEAVHSRTLPWLLEGTVSGVRIDHIDGLREPALYLQQLHDIAERMNGEPPYVVVEKILVGAEELPARWCAAGTTGYEFSGLLNGLFVEETGFAKLKEHFAQVTGVSDFGQLVYDCKKEAMRRLLPAEFAALTRLLGSVTQLSESAAEDVVREVTACLPVYRTYFGSADSGANDRAHIDAALRAAAAHGVAPEHLEEFEHLVLAPSTDQQRDFTLRWQQFTGPVMAKGLEDTALYRYTPLLSVCDVGVDPRFAVTSAADFHTVLARRAACWSGSLNATSTHDSKRGEDVRARINVLSEMSDVWLPMVNRWFELNARFRKTVGTLMAPQPAEELALYQTMVGACALEDGSDFSDRVGEFLLKALREAKERSSWRWQNDAYEEAVLDFARAVLSDHTMLEELRTLERRTSFYGALNSLSQLVLKLGAPGIPDFYQGNELWSLTLVDPDNRRPVNYDLRLRYISEPLSWSNAESWRDGRIKLHVTRAGLALRNEWPDVFEGEYLPLEANGERAHNLIAFERRAGDRRAVFVAARFFTQLCAPEHWPAGDVWESTSLSLGEGTWHERLTNRTIETSAKTPLNTILQNLPFAILTTE